jgi:hypothetical protein
MGKRIITDEEVKKLGESAIDFWTAGPM